MLILEGPDGAGKSTLGRILANIYDTNIYHPGGAPSPDTLNEISTQCIHKLKQGFICDRVNQISEVVYGPVMNNRQLLLKDDAVFFLEQMANMGIVTIYCRPKDIKNMADNQTEEAGRDTPENTAKLKQNHIKLVEGYDAIFDKALKHERTAAYIFTYDYTSKGEFKRLLAYLNSLNNFRNVRPAPEEYFMEMAALVAKRGTCCRRKVGCVLTDKNKFVLATGYNGRPAGFTHCSEGEPCSAAACPSGINLEGCEAIHAEQNALLQCKDTQAIDKAYVTLFPCVTCTKLLLNTSCKTIVYAEEYVQPEAVELWERAGRYLIHQPLK